MRQAQFLLGETPLCPRCCWFEPIMSWPFMGCAPGFRMILVLSDVLITGCVHHGQSSLVLWRGTWCCGLFEVSFVVRPPSRPYMKIRWRPPGDGDHPPRSAMKHCLSHVRSLGKRRFTSDTCRIRVLPWRSERTTFCLCWWFLNCLYKLQVNYTVAMHPFVWCITSSCATCCSAALICTYCIIDHALFMNGSCFPNPWPTHSESKDTNWACSISSPWSGRKPMSIWIACMFQWTLTRPQMYVAICTKPHRRYRKLTCVDCCRFLCRSSSHTARW